MDPRPSLSGDLQPSVPCAQCGQRLFVPEWSEPAGDNRERHLWCCSACGYSFETLVVFADMSHDRAA